MPRPLAGQVLAASLKDRLGAGRPVTSREAARLLARARGAQVAECDALVLVTEYWAGRDAFSAKDRARFERFLTVELPAQIVPDTNSGTASQDAAVQPEHAAMVFLERDLPWGTPQGSLVRGVVSAGDPVQGACEDCFLIAALSAIAHARPERIGEILQDNRDGTYTATFYGRKSDDGPLEPFTVDVDARLPLLRGRLVYGRGRDRRELWPALLEKAYAKWKGDYLFCFDDTSGLPGDALSALTGKDARVLVVLPTSDPRDVASRLEAALADGGAVIAGTRSHAEVPAGVDLEAGHEYTVLALEDRGGEPYVQVRNPRGRSATTKDGVLWLSMRTFVEHFDLVDSVAL